MSTHDGNRKDTNSGNSGGRSKDFEKNISDAMSQSNSPNNMRDTHTDIDGEIHEALTQTGRDSESSEEKEVIDDIISDISDDIKQREENETKIDDDGLDDLFQDDQVLPGSGNDETGDSDDEDHPGDSILSRDDQTGGNKDDADGNKGAILGKDIEDQSSPTGGKKEKEQGDSTVENDDNNGNDEDNDAGIPPVDSSSGTPDSGDIPGDDEKEPGNNSIDQLGNKPSDSHSSPVSAQEASFSKNNSLGDNSGSDDDSNKDDEEDSEKKRGEDKEKDGDGDSEKKEDKSSSDRVSKPSSKTPPQKNVGKKPSPFSAKNGGIKKRKPPRVSPFAGSGLSSMPSEKNTSDSSDESDEEILSSPQRPGKLGADNSEFASAPDDLGHGVSGKPNFSLSSAGKGLLPMGGVSPKRGSGDQDGGQQPPPPGVNAKDDSTSRAPSMGKKILVIILVLVLLPGIGIKSLFGKMSEMMSVAGGVVTIAAAGSDDCVPGKKNGDDDDDDGGGAGDLKNVGDATIPAEGTFTSGFGPRWGTNHNGVDIANSDNTPIYAAHSGEVIDSGPASGFGLWIRIKSDKDPNLITVYGHQWKNHVKVGDKVKAGKHIADMGNNGEYTTGTHLHFETHVDGSPRNPQEWFKKQGLDFPDKEQDPVKLSKSSGGGGSDDSDDKDDNDGGDDNSSASSDNGDGAWIIGDSITVGMSGRYHGNNASGNKYEKDSGKGDATLGKMAINAEVGKAFNDWGYDKLKSGLDGKFKDRDVVVIATVTNGEIDKGKFEEIISKAHSKKQKVVTLTMGTHPEKGKDLEGTRDKNNGIIRGSDAEIIIDWEGEVKENSDYLDDNVHPTDKGKDRLLDLMEEAITKAKNGETGIVGAGGETTGGDDDDEDNEGRGCICVDDDEQDNATSGGDPTGTPSDPNKLIEKYTTLVIAVGRDLGMSDEDIIAAISTVDVESTFQNYANDGTGPRTEGHSGATYDEMVESLEYPHDAVGRDNASVGIFQQQIRFWGKTKDLMIPAFQAGQFYADYEKHSNISDPGARAQKVQGSDKPAEYGKAMPQAKELFKKYKDHPKSKPGGMSSDDKKEGKRGYEERKKNGGVADTSSKSSRSRSGESSGVEDCGYEYGDGDGNDGNEGDKINDKNAGKMAIKAAKIAVKQKGKPYVWGAHGPNSFDCSGLLTYAYREAGYPIDKNQRWMTPDSFRDIGKKVDKKNIAVGDAIVTNGGGHVMMYIGNNQIVEAQTSEVPVLTRSLDDINDIVDIYRIVDKDSKPYKK